MLHLHQPPTSPGASVLQDPDRIAAHIVFMAAEIQEITLETEARRIQGRMDMPNTDRLLPFSPHPAYGSGIEGPLRGMPARLEYAAYGVTYAFDSLMAGVDAEGRWLVQPPHAVSCSDRRLVHRHEVLGDPAFELQLDGPWQPPGFRTFPLLDVSTDGLGFLFDPFRTPIAINEVVEARLLLPTAFRAMRLILRVANLRPWRPGIGRRAAGTRYMDLPLESRKTLALSLSVWSERRKVA
ncbi:MAG: hypothetical protein ABIO70_29105 [Pseudomonadota bacterium]